jgi:ABC-type transport system involved in multi-copper enzyme maturation permease subunit
MGVKMKQFGILYRYELKKIIKKKLLWVTFFICMALTAVSVLSNLMGSYYVDGEIVDTHYHMFLVDSAYSRTLSGRKIDQKLLEEMTEAYGKIPQAADRYTLTEEYQTYARPYSSVFNTVRWWSGMETEELMNWEADEEELYALKAAACKEYYEWLFLTDREKVFWAEKEAQTDKPVTYIYYEGYADLMRKIKVIGMLMLLLTAVCLSGVFPEEHMRRTDQLMLSSIFGKKDVYWAKILAGISVSVAVSALMTVLAAGLSLGIYGSEGFGAAFQLYPSNNLYSYPITMGQACLIAYGMLFIIAILASLFVMVLSELLHSSIAALSVSTGIIVAGIICSVPAQYRVLAQIWNWMPMTVLHSWNIFDLRLLTVFGHPFLAWQALPVIYILCSIGLAVIGKHFYKEYQVSGR